MDHTPHLVLPASAIQMPADEPLSMLDLLAAIGRRRRSFFAISVLGSAAALAWAFTMQRDYVATTMLLPPQQQQSVAAGALSQLGALAGMAGTAPGFKSPEETYAALLRTRRLQDAVIQRFDLKKHYGQALQMNTRARLAGATTITPDKKTGLVTIEVQDADPELAARLANAHVEELRKLLDTLAVTEAQQRRMFFDQQVGKAKEALNQAEIAFRSAQARSGLVVTQALAESGVKTSIELRSRIAGREVQLQALSRFATPENPQAQRLAAELAALKEQLARFEGGAGAGGEGVQPRGIEAVRAFRDMKVQEASLEALIRQSEIARLDEAREGPLLQQVDPALPPERPTKPKRVVVAGAGVVLSVLLGALWAMLRGLPRSGDAASPQWRRFKDAWR